MHISPLYFNETVVFNIVNDVLFIIGIIGLTVANMTVSGDLPIMGRQARIVGIIFLMPIFSTALGVAHWSELLPAILCILAALIYLFFTTPPLEPKTYRFWFAAMIPAISLYIVNYDYFTTGLDPFRKFALFDTVNPMLMNMLSYVLIPVIIALLISRVIPVATSRNKRLLFALPVSLFYLQGSMPSWLASINAIEHPELPNPPGIMEYALGYTIVGLFLFMLTAFAAWIGAKNHSKEPERV